LVGLEIASSKNDFANTDSNPQQALWFLTIQKLAGGILFAGSSNHRAGKKVVKKNKQKEKKDMFP
jgi:hypothetical protein